MSKGWSADFIYAYFEQLLRALVLNFECHLISEAPGIIYQKQNRPLAFLRHDIDVDLGRTLEMAQIENEHHVRATYMVMTNALLYRPEQPASLAVLEQIADMGHEVSLHFEFETDEERKSSPEFSSQLPKIRTACELLEQITGRPVRALSFHQPLPQFMRGPLMVEDRVNSYAQDLMPWYISDSSGAWRDGEPLPKLLNPQQPVLQCLIHPIWWAEEHESPDNRMPAFLKTLSQGLSIEQIKEISDNALGLDGKPGRN